MLLNVYLFLFYHNKRAHLTFEFMNKFSEKNSLIVVNLFYFIFIFVRDARNNMRIPTRKVEIIITDIFKTLLFFMTYFVKTKCIFFFFFFNIMYIL